MTATKRKHPKPQTPRAALRKIHERVAWLNARIPKLGHLGFEEERDRLLALADGLARLIDACDRLVKESVECDDADDTIPHRHIRKIGRFVSEDAWNQFALRSGLVQRRRRRAS